MKEPSLIFAQKIKSTFFNLKNWLEFYSKDYDKYYTFLLISSTYTLEIPEYLLVYRKRKKQIFFDVMDGYDLEDFYGEPKLEKGDTRLALIRIIIQDESSFNFYVYKFDNQNNQFTNDFCADFIDNFLPFYSGNKIDKLLLIESKDDGNNIRKLFYAELPYEDIADQLNISLSTLKRRLKDMNLSRNKLNH